MAKKNNLKAGDFLLTFLVTGLVIFGIIMVFSASYYNSIAQDGSPYDYLRRSLMWAALGFVAMIGGAMIDYHNFRRWSKVILVVSFILLGVVLAGLGHSAGGATRWIAFGPITIMPGELAKPAAIFFSAYYLSNKPERIRSFTKGVLPMLILMGIYFVFIYLQPNTSTAVIVCAIIGGIMFVAGLNLIYLAGIGALGATGLAVLIATTGGYRLERMNFLNPFNDPLGSGYQVCQSLMALGSGGLFGVGLGKSIQKTLYLPEPQNDFILAIIGEELGYVGIIILFCAYILLIWRCIHISLNAPDMFGMLVASGITIMLAVQVVLNVAVVTSSMPPTGVTLPFISYGGNALLVFMACMGVMLNISRHSAQ